MAVPVENEEKGAEPSMVTPHLSYNRNEGVARLREEVYGVGGNNDPAPENIPTLATKDDKVRCHEWGCRSNICYQ